jgi:hypothetical protein
MRYLSLTIDSGWTFGPHFDLLVPKVMAAANALCGLLPNIGGAGTGVRRLYEGVIRSQVLYGAPIWAGDLMANRRSLTLLRRLHRTTAIRIARGYRTISHASASVLAASPPFELQALALQQVYDHLRDLGSGDGGTQPTNCDRPVQDVLREAKRRIWERWRSQLLEEDTTRPRHLSQLGGLEGSRRSPTHIQDDASTHRPRRVRGVPAKNSKRGDVHLSPLPRGGRHGTTHTGALPSVGRTAPRTMPHHRR